MAGEKKNMVLYKKGMKLQLASRPRREGEYLRRAPAWAGQKGGGGRLSDKQMAVNEKFSGVAKECQKEASGLTGNARVEMVNSCIAQRMK